MIGNYWATNNVVALWHLENTTDSSGNSHTLTNNNTVTFPVGKFNNCADFGTGDSNKNLRRDSNFGVGGTADCTYHFWVKQTSEIGSGSREFFIRETTLSTARYLFFEYQYNSGTRRFSINVAGTGLNANYTLGTIWHELVLTRSGNTMSLYIDGNLVGTSTAGTGTSGDNRLIMGVQSDNSQDCNSQLDEFIFLAETWNASRVRKWNAWSRGLLM